MLREADPLALGRASLDQADWSEARLHYEQAAAISDDPKAWEGLSWTGWWLGEEKTTLCARERAYRGYRRADAPRDAARMAMWLASDHLKFRGDDALAQAWLARARTLASDLPPGSEIGYLTLLEADFALLIDGDTHTSARLAREGLELGRELADVGIEVVALAVLGAALVASGASREGLERLDEAAALAVGEEFANPVAPGWALCHTVTACAELGDFQRAAQWCRALHSWSESWHARLFFGVCRTAYGEVLATRGDWSTAEQELQSALADLRATRPGLVAPTAVRLGRLRARQGDLEEARRLYEAALPLPAAIVALGELDLTDGDATAAEDAAHRALRRCGAGVLHRLPALELLARARAAGGDRLGAAEAAEQVETQTERLGTPYMRGRGCLVRAEVLLAAGKHDAARQTAEDAVDLFDACSAPFEAAQARALLARALRALGRPERAASEARAAAELFNLLNVRAPTLRPEQELTPRELDILRLVAAGRGDAEIAERLFLSPHTVHRHVANIRTKLGVPSRAAAVGYATRHGLL